jgi:hypothetical protein
MVVGMLLVWGLLVGPLRGDGAAFDTCTGQGVYSLNALADAGNTVQVLGFMTLTQPSVCTGLGTISVEVDIKPLGGAAQHLTFAGTYFVDADGVFTTNDTVCNSGAGTGSIAAGSDLAIKVGTAGSPAAADARFGWECRP